uniref:Uncharacterized protein n=1 Tax=viral metagenome TaxID=1070528 RepID=A0A6C0EJN1_9ZZZZ
MSGRTKEKTDRRLTRSIRLRKYESVYRECTRHSSPKHSSKHQHHSFSKHHHHTPEHKHKDSTARKKKSLNSYQQFVKEESKKEKYQSMRGSERFAAIAAVWEHKKRYGKRKKKPIKS